jgi:hypothetical protein
LSTKQLEAKPGDMLHVQAYQKAKENATMLTSSIIQHKQGTMEGNLIENENNALNKGLANLLIREKLKQN